METRMNGVPAEMGREVKRIRKDYSLLYEIEAEKEKLLRLCSSDFKSSIYDCYNKAMDFISDDDIFVIDYEFFGGELEKAFGKNFKHILSKNKYKGQRIKLYLLKALYHIAKTIDKKYEHTISSITYIDLGYNKFYYYFQGNCIRIEYDNHAYEFTEESSFSSFKRDYYRRCVEVIEFQKIL